MTTNQPDKFTVTMKPKSEMEAASAASAAASSTPSSPSASTGSTFKPLGPGVKLISAVKQLNRNFNDNKEGIMAERNAKREEHEKRMAVSREKGSVALFEHLKNQVPEKVQTYAGYGRTEARVFEFTFGEECKFEGCYAKDLLTKGTVIPRLQAWLDEEHSNVVEGTDPPTKERAFLCYFNMAGHQKPDRRQNKYAVFVNWDKDSWDNIQKRLENRDLARDRRSEMRRERRPVRDSENHESRLDGQDAAPMASKSNTQMNKGQRRSPESKNPQTNGQRSSRPPRDNQDRQTKSKPQWGASKTPLNMSKE